ncbi:hypothetical protein [Magnetospirillum sp. XM-1]|uniref:hypothetical protein n=1 Tax=Magnetospirillum sp. XM-1 TaxID=1663591 RepID=UPI0012E39058|nr:hypothetical protein [Magnetospirillum sp. XM-1]
MIDLHRISLQTQEIDDVETLQFCHDLRSVMTSLHQGMPVVGPWMEARVKQMIRDWLPSGWCISGPSQIFRREREGVRSRSWDIIIHKIPVVGCDIPPPASAHDGYPLLPVELVAAVIDTKTNFSDPMAYARQPVFNLMNNSVEAQLDFIGNDILKVIFAASSLRSADSIFESGNAVGLLSVSLGRYRAGPVADGLQRKTEWWLERLNDGRSPLQVLKAALMARVQAA